MSVCNARENRFTMDSGFEEEAMSYRDHKTKIVCTIGPATDTVEMMQNLITSAGRFVCSGSRGELDFIFSGLRRRSKSHVCHAPHFANGGETG
jgi:hypothetical protein